ncbi:hypothetical protein F1B92_05375 [Campylobacter sp. FMV-PI01]|uniref:Uncharacterized protein n=1 Tax=Campylobacter portucalensis TaxID=2608384 RepID=A0A6L5WHE8_9BACT|nr:hypothetical protein [Campylobacter portucalensis]MSN96600.1 hypothetical protein [Campylobacter portucalensis]
MEIYYENLDELLKWDGLKVGFVASSKGMSINLVNHALYKNALNLVKLYDDFDLCEFNVVIISNDIDEIYLKKVWNKFDKYLQNGGILVNFASNHFDLIPGAKPYIQSPYSIKDRFIKESDFEIFKGVSEYDMNYRRGVKGFFNRGYIIPPLGSFCVLKDCYDECICYIDTKSSNGVIINTAGSCLLSYGIFENTTSRRMGINFLKFLQKIVSLDKNDIKYPEFEVAKYKELDNSENVHLKRLSDIKKNKSLKNAIITGGSNYHLNFFKNKNAKYENFFDKVIYQFDLENEDISKFDYLVIASRCSDEILSKSKEKLNEFTKNGGYIVSLGDSHSSYLPNIKWNDYPVNFWWWIMPGANMSLFPYENHELFKTLDLSDCKWHYHGGYIAPKGSEKILINEIGESIIYKYKNHYITSLDPDYHFGQGFMPKTELFFDRFIEWIEKDISKK